MASRRPLSDSPPPTTIGAILTGGQSRRFASGDKAAAIGPHVLATLRLAGVDPVIAVGGAPDGLFAPAVADRYPGEGPLGGVATALTYARRGRVLAVTCDLPLLDEATVRAVLDAATQAADDAGVVAAVDGTPQVSLGSWPAAWARPLHAALGDGQRRFRHLLKIGPVEMVEVDPDALLDADDDATLAELERVRPANHRLTMDTPPDPSA